MMEETTPRTSRKWKPSTTFSAHFQQEKGDPVIMQQDNGGEREGNAV